MNRTQICRVLHEKHGLMHSEAKKVMDAFLDSIREALVNGDKRVIITGLGTFWVCHAYKGSYPRFRASGNLKALINVEKSRNQEQKESPETQPGDVRVGRDVVSGRSDTADHVLCSQEY